MGNKLYRLITWKPRRRELRVCPVCNVWWRGGRFWRHCPNCKPGNRHCPYCTTEELGAD